MLLYSTANRIYAGRSQAGHVHRSRAGCIPCARRGRTRLRARPCLSSHRRVSGNGIPESYRTSQPCPVGAPWPTDIHIGHGHASHSIGATASGVQPFSRSRSPPSSPSAQVSANLGHASRARTDLAPVASALGDLVAPCAPVLKGGCATPWSRQAPP